MILCPHCNTTKETYHFSYRTDTKKLRRICSMCHKGYRSNIKARNKKEQELILDNKKECSKCHEIKNTTEFHKDKNTTTGFCSRCKSCIQYLQILNSDKRHKQTLKYRYNLTNEEYILYGKITHCQICNTEFSEKYRKCLDHCHTELKYRGVLCSYCNIGLGHFKDDKQLLLNAIKYLK
jgi:hypothetical protein